MCYVYTSSATFRIFNKVANKAQLHCDSEQELTRYSTPTEQAEHWYAAAAGGALTKPTTEQQEPEGRATAGVAVTVH